MRIQQWIFRFTFFVGSLLLSPGVLAGMEDDPLLYRVMIDRLELRNTEGADPKVWEGQGWLGKDLNKLWVKTEGEYADGKTEEAELQLLYSRAIAPFWDAQIGLRRDFQPNPERNWVALGFQGLAPYVFEVDAALFVGPSGRIAARLEAEYEILFTQRLILSPELEVNLHGQDDSKTGTGSGLSDIEAGLRLRYEVRREFAPYIGVNWWRKYADTADFSRNGGEQTTDVQWVVGVRAWF